MTERVKVKKIDLFYVALFVIAELTMVITIVSVYNDRDPGPYRVIDTETVSTATRFPIDK